MSDRLPPPDLERTLDSTGIDADGETVPVRLDAHRLEVSSSALVLDDALLATLARTGNDGEWLLLELASVTNPRARTRIWLRAPLVPADAWQSLARVACDVPDATLSNDDLAAIVARVRGVLHSRGTDVTLLRADGRQAFSFRPLRPEDLADHFGWTLVESTDLRSLVELPEVVLRRREGTLGLLFACASLALMMAGFVALYLGASVTLVIGLAAISPVVATLLFLVLRRMVGGDDGFREVVEFTAERAHFSGGREIDRSEAVAVERSPARPRIVAADGRVRLLFGDSGYALRDLLTRVWSLEMPLASAVDDPPPWLVDALDAVPEAAALEPGFAANALWLAGVGVGPRGVLPPGSVEWVRPAFPELRGDRLCLVEADREIELVRRGATTAPTAPRALRKLIRRVVPDRLETGEPSWFDA